MSTNRGNLDTLNKPRGKQGGIILDDREKRKEVEDQVKTASKKEVPFEEVGNSYLRNVKLLSYQI